VKENQLQTAVPDMPDGMVPVNLLKFEQSGPGLLLQVSLFFSEITNWSRKKSGICKKRLLQAITMPPF
jgi:hypothetical protein